MLDLTTKKIAEKKAKRGASNRLEAKDFLEHARYRAQSTDQAVAKGMGEANIPTVNR